MKERVKCVSLEKEKGEEEGRKRKERRGGRGGRGGGEKGKRRKRRRGGRGGVRRGGGRREKLTKTLSHQPVRCLVIECSSSIGSGSIEGVAYMYLSRGISGRWPACRYMYIPHHVLL